MLYRITRAFRDGDGPLVDAISGSRDLKEETALLRAQQGDTAGIEHYARQHGLSADNLLAEWEALKTLNDTLGVNQRLSAESIANGQAAARIRATGTQVIKEETAATKEATEAIHEHVAGIEEQRDHTERMDAATQSAKAAIDAKARADQRAAQDAQEHADRIAELERAFQALKDNLSDRSAYLGLQDQLDQVGIAATTAWEAASTGAADSQAATRSHEQATIDLKDRVIDYIEQVGNIPPEKATEILALIDEGKLAEAEAKLAHIERVRYVNVDLRVTDSQVRVNQNGRIIGASESGTGKAYGGETRAGVTYPILERGQSEILEENGQYFLLSARNGRVTPLPGTSENGPELLAPSKGNLL